jgi:hypothetical protein
MCILGREGYGEDGCGWKGRREGEGRVYWMWRAGRGTR